MLRLIVAACSEDFLWPRRRKATYYGLQAFEVLDSAPVTSSPVFKPVGVAGHNHFGTKVRC